MSPTANPESRAPQRSTSAGRGSWIWRITLGGLALSGGLGLLALTGGRATEVAIAAALPGLQAAWSTPAAGLRMAAVDGRTVATTMPVVLDTTHAAPQGGDEGFWLNSAALAGNSGQTLTMGDPITMGDRRYVVTELTPLTLAAGKDGLSKGAHGLTLVVASEVATEGSASQPRRLRFLVDSLPSVAKPTAELPLTGQGSL